MTTETGTVALLTLGGTIAMAGASHSGVVTRLTGADLAAAVPGWDTLDVRVDIHDVRAMPSAGLRFADILEVVERAGAAVLAGARGVVVTQGTDTIEETAYLIDLVWPHPQPIVVTGAMRNPTLAGPDGPANLLAAIRTAAATDSRDLGALVVLNDEIHAARWVRKTHSTSTATFASPNTGPVGHVIEGAVRVLARPARIAAVPVPAAETLATTAVPLHTVTLDDDATLLALLAGEDAPPIGGLIVSAFGVGHVPPDMAATLETIAARVPVVLTSRTGAGSVLRHTYASAGGEIDLLRRGLIDGGLLHPAKARILLRMLVAGGAGDAAIRLALRDHR